MSNNDQHPPRTAGSELDAASAMIADFIDLVCNVGREIRYGESANYSIVRLSSTEGGVMRHVDQHPGVTSSELAAAMGLRRSNLSTILKSLEGSELIERKIDEQDGRVVTIHPTDKAAANLSGLRAEWVGMVSEALEGQRFSFEESLALLRALESGLVRRRRDND